MLGIGRGLSLSGGLGVGAGLALRGGGGCTPHDQIDGSVSLGQTFTHPADFVGGFTLDALPTTSSTHPFDFRAQDDNNCWEIHITSAGNLRLVERVAGIPSIRGTAAGVLSAGHRIVAVADGATIRVYSNNTLRITYSSATNFSSATSGEIGQLAFDCAVSELKTWTLACRAEEGV